MHYANEWEKFRNSQYLNDGIRLTVAVLIPAFILYHFNLLGAYFSIPLGVVLIGFTDSPGPYDHRKNSLIASLIINFFVSLLSGFLHFYNSAVFFEIIIFGVVFSIIGVYGNRIASVGTVALFVFIFNIDARFNGIYILYNALFFTLGGLWYFVIAIGLQKLRPYRLIQQMLGENLIETAHYLKLKGKFYERNIDENILYNEVSKSQTLIQQHHEDLRGLIFKTREVVNESTIKGRTLTMMFLNTIDLFERVVTSQQDYKTLHKQYDDTNILNDCHSCISNLSNILEKTGLAVQTETGINESELIDKTILKFKTSYENFREEHLTGSNIDTFIRLKNILSSIENIGEKIKQIQEFSFYDKRRSNEFKTDINFDKFISHSTINQRLFLDNLTLHSLNFRHGIRLVAAMLIGYFVSFFFPVGHDYWILLTVCTIIKPSYSITKQRNFNRLAGTLLGAAFGFAILYFLKEKPVLFVCMLFAMILAFTFLRINYLLASSGITIYVLLSFYFLSPDTFRHVLNDRVVDTAIGSFIAFIVSILILPNWEHEKIKEYSLLALKANHVYFLNVANLINKNIYNENNFKLARKNAFVSLSNLSDNFQKMMTEPKRKRKNIPYYHQFVSASYLLTSYIATLSYYAEKFNNQFGKYEFEEYGKTVDKSLENAENIIMKKEFDEIDLNFRQNLDSKISELLKMRESEISFNKKDAVTSTREQLFSLKTVNDQFALILATTMHQEKILKEINNYE